MKTGMNLLLWTAEITPGNDALIADLKKIGFDSVEIPVFNVESLANYKHLAQTLKKEGLGATAVTVVSPETNPISPDPAVRQAAVDYLTKVLDCCAAFGCEVLCGPIHSALGHFSGTGPTATEFGHGVETMRKVAELAKERQVQLAAEYLNRFEIYFLTTAADAAKFVDAVDHPSFRMMFDSFHAHIEEKGQASAIATAGKRIVHAHVSENDRGTPGSGQVDWDGYFQGLKAIGFDGYLTIEAFGRALPELAAATRVWRDLFPDAMGLCREGLAHIQKHMG